MIKSKLKSMIPNQKVNYFLIGVLIFVIAVLIYSVATTYKIDSEKKQYQSEVKDLKSQINNLKIQVGVLEKEYYLISTKPEKERIINIQTKYAKDSIFIRYAPVSYSDSIIRTKLNSIR